MKGVRVAVREVMNARGLRVGSALLVAAWLAGCGTQAPRTVPPSGAAAQQAAQPSAAPAPVPAPVVAGVTTTEEYWLPPLFVSPEDEAHYYISRLPDRRFVTTYGGPEHPRPWYIAAERLGRLGEPAIPLLVARLDSADAYELMLALYALQLASQDPRLMAQTGGDYIQLDGVLTEGGNAANRVTALAWWQRHGWRWQ